jgi:hypothetical protein
MAIGIHSPAVMLVIAIYGGDEIEELAEIPAYARLMLQGGNRPGSARHEDSQDPAPQCRLPQQSFYFIGYLNYMGVALSLELDPLMYNSHRTILSILIIVIVEQKEMLIGIYHPASYVGPHCKQEGYLQVKRSTSGGCSADLNILFSK